MASSQAPAVSSIWVQSEEIVTCCCFGGREGGERNNNWAITELFWKTFLRIVLVSRGIFQSPAAVGADTLTLSSKCQKNENETDPISH